MLKKMLSYLPYDIYWQYESFSKKNLKKDFIDNIKFSINGTALSKEEKIELTKDRDKFYMYADSHLIDKHKCYRKGKIMVYNNQYFPEYKIGLGRIAFSRKFYSPDFGCRVKPILRPLSDLNKEITINKKSRVFSPNKTDTKIVASDFFMDIYNCKVSEVDGLLCIEKMNTDIHVVYQKLMEWHFDVYSLIKDGLAVNMNNL